MLGPRCGDHTHADRYDAVATLSRDFGFVSVARGGRHPAVADGAERLHTEEEQVFMGVRVLDGPGAKPKRKGVPGRRVKHRVKGNWLETYDKGGSILRVEMVINHADPFTVRRSVRRNGKRVKRWVPMRKGVGWLFRYRGVSLKTNMRYLDALAVVLSPAPALRQLDAVTNVDLRNKLVALGALARGDDRRHAARVSRILPRLHTYGLITKVRRSRRWRVSAAGLRIMSAAIELRKRNFPDARTPAAA